ncbi:WD40/YVTN/BNR-like repeat-containing protein [Pontibacter toksunensis]|uniref:WD40/YVTN/BNR-like repeat-containing protein n=1 Tax=Pontibacter toksunensis TaxID=1332631 RepID=A0ABW6BZP5_9BACT
MKRIAKLYSLLLLLLALQSCESDDDITPQVQWEKIEFADQGPIYSIHGSLEDGLLLGTLRGVIKVTDNGKTSKEVLRVDTPITNLIKDGDVITAVTNIKNYSSRDGGETWHDSDKTYSPFHNREVYDSKGIIYHHVALNNGELGTPSLIMRSSDRGTNWENIFPHKRNVYSMYLDNTDRLYLGTSGSEWDGQSFTAISNAAVLYYMKK